MRKAIRSLLVMGLLLLPLGGCDEDPVDVTPPAIPDGLSTITGDGEIWLIWNANREFDLAGYRVFYGNDRSVHLINVNANQTKSFNIPDLKVGETYYFAISAYDSTNKPAGADAKLILNVLKEKKNGSKRHRRGL